MYNIQKAVGRLRFAPKLKEIEITDIKAGAGAFAPKPGERVSFAALKNALKRAGYTLASAEITIKGTLGRRGESWTIVADSSAQEFSLEDISPKEMLTDEATGARVEVVGDWKTTGDGDAAREVVSHAVVKKPEASPEKTTTKIGGAQSGDTRVPRFIPAGFDASGGAAFSGSHGGAEMPSVGEPRAPIRVTSPGLTVYRGGAVVPRLYFVKQHLGDLNVSRQVLDVSLSYTPTEKLQLEAEAPLSRTSYDDGVSSGSGVGLGNVTLW
ncbi:MAG TPA: hypothetical protein VM934_05140, partial [Pyrinomonadaceae bacterium]|nr:hypothetical protein [Pyrinomonadaceae bacterium]